MRQKLNFAKIISLTIVALLLIVSIVIIGVFSLSKPLDTAYADHDHSYSYGISDETLGGVWDSSYAGWGLINKVLTATCVNDGCNLTNNNVLIKLVGLWDGGVPLNTNCYYGAYYYNYNSTKQFDVALYYCVGDSTNKDNWLIYNADTFTASTGITPVVSSINYTGTDNVNGEYNSTNAPSNSGEYVATITLTIDSQNYTLSKEYSISRARLHDNLIIFKSSVYNGQEQPIFYIDSMPENVEVEFKYNGASDYTTEIPTGINAGESIVVSSWHAISHDPNYADYTYNFQYTYSITPYIITDDNLYFYLDGVEIQLETVPESSYVQHTYNIYEGWKKRWPGLDEITIYDGHEYKLEVKTAGINGDTITLLTTTRTNVGIAGFNSLTSNTNYAADGSAYQNYSIKYPKNTQYGMYIFKADYDMSGVVYETSKPYNGEAQYLSVSNLPNGADGIQVTATPTGDGVTYPSDGGKVQTVTFSTTSTNYNVPTSVEKTFSVTKKEVIISLGEVGCYDGKAKMPVATFNGAAENELATVELIDNTQDNINAGTFDIKITVDTDVYTMITADNCGYTINSGVGFATITIPKVVVVVTGISVADRAYNGSAIADLDFTNVNMNWLVNEEDVSISATGTFYSKNASQDPQIVTISNLELVGIDSANYVLAEAGQQTETTATIYKKSIVVSNITPHSTNKKKYDGETSISIGYFNISNVIYDGIVDGETLTISFTATLEDKYPGENKTAYLTELELGGDYAINYVLADNGQQTEVNNLVVQKKGITIYAIQVQSSYFTEAGRTRVYNGTEYYTFLASEFRGIGYLGGEGPIVGDDIQILTITAQVTNKNVGSKSFTFYSATLGGVDAESYVVGARGTNSFPSYMSYSVVQKAITANGITTTSREYDGTTSLSSSYIDLTNASLVGVCGDDDVTISSESNVVGTFADKNVGVNKLVALSGIVLEGAQAGNYTISVSTLVSITAKVIVATSITAEDKVYDRTTTATVDVSQAVLTGIVDGDEVGLTYASITAAFADKNVGTDKKVTVTGFSLNGTDKGNYALGENTTTANITAKEVCVLNISADDKIYDGTTDATLDFTYVFIDGKINGDDLSATATGTFVSKNVSDDSVFITISNITLTGLDKDNYCLSLNGQQSGTAAFIYKKPVVVSNIISASNTYPYFKKSYDGTKNIDDLYFVKDNAVFTGIVDGDNLTVKITKAELEDKYPGDNKTATIISMELGGTDANNYYLAEEGQQETVSDFTVNEKRIVPVASSVYIQGNPEKLTNEGSKRVYNGTEYYTFYPSDFRSLVWYASASPVEGDDVYLISVTVRTAYPDVGKNRAFVYYSWEVAGTDVDNYIVAYDSNNSFRNMYFDIIPKELTVTGITAENKIYDGTTILESGRIDLTNMSALIGVCGDDEVSISNSSVVVGTFADKNTGNNKHVTLSGFVLEGEKAGNYTVSATTTATIVSRSISVKNIIANDKEYDSNKNADLDFTSATLYDVVDGDTVSLVYTSAYGFFDTKDVGENKTIEVLSLDLSGTDKDNYTINACYVTADITAKEITVTGITAEDKVYNGNTNATLNYSNIILDGILGEDDLSATATGTFASKNASEENITVAISNITLTGEDAKNYSLASSGQQESTIAKISKQAIVVSGIKVTSKTYDGTCDIDDSCFNKDDVVFDGKVDGDNLTITVTAELEDKYTGENKTATITSLVLGGADVNNYYLAEEGQQETVTNVTVLKRSIRPTGGQLTAEGRIREYTGSQYYYFDENDFTSVGYPNGQGPIQGDEVKIHIKATAQSVNVGHQQLIFVEGSFTGLDSDSYEFGSTTQSFSGIYFDIVPKTLTVTGITVEDKVYDGTTSAVVNTTQAILNGVADGETITIIKNTVAGSFEDKNVGENKVVTISGFTIYGDTSSNYTLGDCTTTATITAKEVTISGIIAMNKLYDSNTNVSLRYDKVVFDGMVENDDLSVSTTGSFATKNAGNGIVVNLGALVLSGADAGNYVVKNDSQTTALANIEKIGIVVVTLHGINKEYDGNTEATIDTTHAFLQGLIEGDDVGAYVTGEFEDKNVGTNKDVIITNIELIGSDKDNYYMSNGSQTKTNASITPKTITIYAGITASNKTYDGTTDAELDTSAALISGFIDGDKINITATGTFSDVNVGTEKDVLLSAFAISGTDADNYVLAETGNQEKAYASIYKRNITVTIKDTTSVYGESIVAAQTTVGSTKVVDGEEDPWTLAYKVSSEENAEDLSATTNVGTYVVIGTCTNDNYQVSFINSNSTSIYGKYTITKATFGEIVFNDAEFTYDGTPKSITISTALNDEITVSYEGNNQVKAGTYEVTAKFTVSNNYNDIEDVKATLTINKATYDMTGIEFNDAEYTYDGTKKLLKISGDLPEGVTVGYFTNGLIFVGSITATAVFFVDKDNYNEIASMTAVLTITKATYNMDGVSFNDAEYTYDGTTKSVEISGVLPTGVTVNYSNNTLTDVGTITATATFTGDYNNYNEIANMTAVITIKKATFGEIEFNDAEYTYDGTAKSVAISTVLNDEITVSYEGNNQVNVGTYEVTAKFTVSNNYNAIEDIKATLTINKATYNMNGIEFYDAEYIYDGNKKTVEISGVLPTGVTVNYSDNTLTDVGIITATATFTGDYDNYNEIADMTAVLSITKATFGAIVFNDAEFIYDGTPKSITISTVLNDEITVSYEGNNQVKAGTYEVTAKFTVSNNYNAMKDVKATLTITKATYNMTGIAFNDITVTYDGLVKTVLISGTLPEGVTVAYTNNTLTNVGSTTATAIFTGDYDNYNAIDNMTAVLTITKATIAEIVFNDAEYTYDGTAKSIAISTILNNEIIVSYEGNNKVNVGTYEVTAKFEVSGNYNAIEDVKATLTITKATYDMTGIAFNNITVTYDGLVKTALIEGNLPTGVTVAYTNNTLTNVGVITATASFTGDYSNYNEIADMTAVITITKATYDITDIAFNDITAIYDGTVRTAVISGTLPEGVIVAYTNNTLTNAGVITATAIFNGDYDNYNEIANMTAVVTINKATYNMTDVKFDNVTVVYDGNEKVAVISGDLPTGLTVSYTNNKLTNVGSVTAIATFVGDYDNYNVVEDMTATLTITKANPVFDLTKVETKFNYTGSAQSISGATVNSNGEISYVGNSFTKVGSHEVTVKSAETQNYLAGETKVIVTVLEALPVENEDGSKTFVKEIDETAASTEGVSLTDIFNNANAEEGTSKEVKATIGTTEIVFDASAIAAIAGKDVKLQLNVVTTSEEDENKEAEMVMDIVLTGATFEQGKVTVTAVFDKQAPKGMVSKVYYVDADGNRTDMNATFEDGKVKFETNHFSRYIVVFEKEQTGLSGGAIAGIVIGCVVFASLLAFAALYLLKKKRVITK